MIDFGIDITRSRRLKSTFANICFVLLCVFCLFVCLFFGALQDTGRGYVHGHDVDTVDTVVVVVVAVRQICIAHLQSTKREPGFNTLK